ncbi:MAG: MarR family winged helix-turn-helix transcriptional regulator [Thaumarchaeota archaeon]|nr:MarR family winged helix-turn-helix transcriptional regulator [Nitrososphaerota archaeon]
MEKKKTSVAKRPKAALHANVKKKEPAEPKKEAQVTEKKRAGSEKPQRATTSLTEKTEEELVDLTSRVYKLVVERGKDGVLQSEIWKELGLTSRDGSRLAIRLEKRGMIKRVKVLDDGRWTYKLTPLRLPANISSMESAPCIVCPVESKCSVTTEVNPFTCPLIGPWVMKEHSESELMVVTTTTVA